MADYHPLIARAVAGLEKNTGENRRALYERARTALVAQLRGVVPALDESEITRERLALEEAIRKVEAESARHAREVPRPLPPKRPLPQRPAAPPSRPAAAPPSEPGDAGPPGSDRAPSPPQERPPRDAKTLSDAAMRSYRDGMTDAPPPGETRPRLPPMTGPSPPRPGAPPPPTHDFGQFEPPVAEPDDTWAPPEGGPPPHPVDFDEQREQAPRSRPQRQPVADDDDHAPPRLRPQPVYRRFVRAAVLLLVILAIGVLAFWQRDTIAGAAGSLMARFRTPATPVAREPAAPAAQPKIPDRLGQPATQPAGPQVAQRVVLYEEDPDDPQGKRYTGTVIWKTEMMAAAPGRAPELAVRANIEVPDKNMSMTWSLRRNTDQSLPASHTIEIMFNLPADSPSGGVQNVPGVLMKQAEQTRGVPLAGLAVKVTPGYFLIGLSALEADMQRNLQLLKDRTWFDIPIVYNNNRRAILAMEKGTPGDKVFAEAFAAWKQ